MIRRTPDLPLAGPQTGSRPGKPFVQQPGHNPAQALSVQRPVHRATAAQFVPLPAPSRASIPGKPLRTAQSEQPIKTVRPITVRPMTVLQPGPIPRVTNDPGQATRRPTTAVTPRGARTPGRTPGVPTPGLRKTIQEIPIRGLRHPAAPRVRTAGLRGSGSTYSQPSRSSSTYSRRPIGSSYSRPSRSYSAPSRSSGGPSYSAPSRSTYTPSRSSGSSSGGSRSYSAPSRSSSSPSRSSGSVSRTGGRR